MQIRDSLLTHIVYQLNPDGFILGTNGSNAAGVNQYWDFRLNDYDQSPETVALWNWINKHVPNICVDFHTLVYNTNGHYTAYIKPIINYHGDYVRQLAKPLNDAVIRASKRWPAHGGIINLPTTLSYFITNKWNTIAYSKYHIVLKHGVQRSKGIGLEVWLSLVNTYLQHRKAFSDSTNVLESIHCISRRLNWLYRWYLRQYLNLIMIRVTKIFRIFNQ